MTDRARYLACLMLALSFFFIYKAKSSGYFSKDTYNPSINPIQTTQNTNYENPQEKQAVPGFPVNINKASVEELTVLPGIGEKTAQRIIEKRLETGGFRSIDELYWIKYLGKAKVEKLKPLITID